MTVSEPCAICGPGYKPGGDGCRHYPATLLPCLYLQGNYDLSVALHCRERWDGGQPLAYYYPDAESNPYAGRSRPTFLARDLAALVTFAVAHTHETEEPR